MGGRVREDLPVLCQGLFNIWSNMIIDRPTVFNSSCELSNFSQVQNEATSSMKEEEFSSVGQKRRYLVVFNCKLMTEGFTPSRVD